MKIELLNFVEKDTFLLFCVLVLVALAALLSERSGIINIALEGQLIAATLGYTLISFLLKGSITQDYWKYFIGLLGAIAFTLVVTVIFGFLVISMRMNQILTALALNIIMLGLAKFMIVSIKMKTSFFPNEDYVSLFLSDSFKTYFDLGKIGLEGISIIYQIIPVLLIIVLLYFFLFRTKPGLRLRSCGENPKITLMNGISVTKFRFLALIIGGCFIGFAGTFLAEWKTSFNGDVSGLGYLGLSMLILGMRNIWIISLFAAFFVVLQTFVFSISGSELQELLRTVNYLLPLLTLAVYGKIWKQKSGKNAPPRSLGW